jgi:hypothetical protein
MFLPFAESAKGRCPRLEGGGVMSNRLMLMTPPALRATSVAGEEVRSLEIDASPIPAAVVMQ